MEFCAECGTKNDAFATTCVNCGNALASAKPAKVLDPPVSTPEPSTPSVFCGECGSKNTAGVAFCGSCGKPLSSGNPQPTQSQQPSQYQQPQQQLSTQGYQNQPNYSAQPQYQAPNQGYHQGNQPYNPAYGPNQGYYPPGQAPPNFYHPGKKNAGLAVLISIFIPGFGYMYTNQVGVGILYTLVVYFLYSFLIGFFVHLYLIYAGKKQVDTYNYNLFMRTQGQGQAQPRTFGNGY